MNFHQKDAFVVEFDTAYKSEMMKDEYRTDITYVHVAVLCLAHDNLTSRIISTKNIHYLISNYDNSIVFD